MRARFSDRFVAHEKAHGLLNQLDKASLGHLPIESVADTLGVELVETRLDGACAQLIVGRHGPRILLSDQLSEPEDRTWSIAHELGHYVCGHAAPPVSELCRARANRCLHDHPDERAADAFASVVLMPPRIVAPFCDRTPMTVEIPMQLAETCSVPWDRAALRITETSWQVCAVVFSEHGRIRWIGPSLPFAMLCGNRLRPGRPVGPGALARRAFDTGRCPEGPELVPAAAWIAGCGPEARIMEDSIADAEGQVSMTMLWDPTDTGIPRPALATPPFVTACRDALLDTLNDQAAAMLRTQA